MDRMLQRRQMEDSKRRLQIFPRVEIGVDEELERWIWVRAPLYRSHGRRQNSLRVSHFPNAVQQRLISGLISTFRGWIETMGTHAACMVLHAPELSIPGREILLAKGACSLGAALCNYVVDSSSSVLPWSESMAKPVRHHTFR